MGRDRHVNNRVEFASKIIRWLASGLLFFAALTKVFSLLATRQPSVAYVAGQVLLATTEVICAGALVLIKYPRISQVLGAIIFSGFSGISLGRWWLGDVSCGCFGEFIVPPVATVVIDVTLLTGLLLSFPLRKLSLHFAGVLLCCSLVSLTALAVLFAQSRAHSTNFADLMVPGKRLAVMPYLQSPCNLTRGQWTILFVRQGCSSCDSQVAKVLESRSVTRAVAIIDVSPAPLHAAASYYPPGANCISRLAAQNEWAVDTPILLQVSEGIIESSSRLPPATKSRDSAFPNSILGGH